MHFPLTLLSTTALLSALASAAPLPAPAAPLLSCSNEINVGVGVGVAADAGAGTGGPVKVRQGAQGRCPSGWTRSLVEVNLCIEVGGAQHKDEQKHIVQPKNKSVKTSPAAWRAGATPRIKNVKGEEEHDHRSRPKKTSSTTSARRTPAPTAHANKSAHNNKKKKCPDGQRLDDGSVLDLCVDIDTDPLFLGGGIKIGHGPVRATTTTTRARSAAQTSKPKKQQQQKEEEEKKKCPDGQTRGTGALLDMCVDIDTNPLHLGAGIKIVGTGGSSGGGGGGEQRGRVTKPTPAASSRDGKEDLPPCGEDDPLALLDLCVKVDDLLGAKVKLGGSPAADRPRNKNKIDDEDWGTFNGGAGVKIGLHSPSSSTATAARARQTPARINNNKNTDDGADGLPACDGNDDPNAALNLCVKVGSTQKGKDPLVGVGASVLGEKGTKAKATVGGATVADVSLDDKGLKADVLPGLVSVDSTGEGENKFGGGEGLLNVGVGGLLKAQVLAASPDSPTPKRPSSTPVFKPAPNSNSNKAIHQTAPVRSSPSAQRNRNDEGDEPLVSANGAAKVTTPDFPARSAKKEKDDCPPGEVLRLGVCVQVEANVAGVVKADAAAKVGI
ncbi:hypothetical protein JCM6882_003452 [Rhodosporidiobolus microsporus]